VEYDIDPAKYSEGYSALTCAITWNVISVGIVDALTDIASWGDVGGVCGLLM